MYSINTKWSKGDIITPDGDIGKLIINKNKIEFYLKGQGDIFPCNFVGQDNHKFKVFTYGQDKSDSKGFYYKVSKAFLFNDSDYSDFSGDNIENIKSFSFEIPELVDWLKKTSVEFKFTEDGKALVHELDTPIIVLKDNNPKIYIKYQIKDFINGIDDICEMTIKKTPRIFIEFTELQGDSFIVSIIEIIMRFFSLFIGRISTADDIMLDFLDKDQKMWLFINHDFSMNSNRNAYWTRNRTKFEDINNHIQQWFENWYSFSQNNSFKFLQDAFFQIFSKKTFLLEDIFLTYCRFLEGYDLRKSKDEDIATSIREQLKEILKEKSVSDFLKPIFKDVGLKYEYKEVAKWISNGYLGRKTLESRIKRLDEGYFSIIGANSKSIIKEDSPIVYYSKIVKTRNLYSHFKDDSSGTFSNYEIYRTLLPMEILITSILFSEIGLEKEVIKEILVHDEVFWTDVTHLNSN